MILGRNYQVHRLVASTFLGLPPTANHWQVNHLDGDPLNNHVSNLCYATPSQNVQHSWDCNPNRRSGADILAKPVLWRACGAHSWSYCSSIMETSRVLGVACSSVSLCCRGLRRRASANGMWYDFKFAARPDIENCDQPQSGDEIWVTATYTSKSGPESVPDVLVSNYGRIQSKLRKYNHICYGSHRGNGYLFVRRAGRHFSVHRLVAASFLGHPLPADLEVHHKDGNRANNALHNLEYVTRSQNMLHAHALRKGQGRAGRRGRPVQALSVGSESEWQRFPSIKAAALHTGLSQEVVSQICHGRRAQSHSWQLKFVEEQLQGEEWRPVVLAGARVSRR